MSEHTKEPIQVGVGYNSEDEQPMFGLRVRLGLLPVNAATARRLQDCYNALAGMNPEAVTELIAACHKARRDFAVAKITHTRDVTAIEAALLKLETTG